MTAIGHEALTQAVKENLSRRAKNIEVRSEHLPSDIRQALATLIERVIALEALTVQQAETINALNLKLVSVEKEAADIRAVMNDVGQEALRKLGRVA